MRGLAGMEGPALRVLSLRRNFLSDQASEDVARLLQAPLQLHALRLQGNSLGDRTGERVAQAALEHKHLLELSLAHNRMGDRTGYALLDCLNQVWEETKAMIITSRFNS